MAQLPPCSLTTDELLIKAGELWEEMQVWWTLPLW
jgi:hypothetical protein